MARPRGDALSVLFDESRDPESIVTDRDWHPDPGSPLAELDGCDSVRQRRAWFLALRERGLV